MKCPTMDFGNKQNGTIVVVFLVFFIVTILIRQQYNESQVALLETLEKLKTRHSLNCNK